MFQKLRLKLTLINALIILALFLVLATGAYYFSQFDINRRTVFIARMMMTDIQSGRLTDLPMRNPVFPAPQEHQHPPGPPSSLPPGPSGPPPGHAFFFVKTSPSGSITFQSSSQPLPASALIALAQSALQSDSPQGTLELEQSDYFYLKSPLNNESGTLILFHDLSPEQTILRIMLTALTVVGVLCALLSFGASFFMANRAMIPIKKAWQQQKDFLSDASHELRTPLAVIQANLDMIQTSPDETVASQSKWLDNIQQVSVSMAKLVDSLLFLARTDAQQPALNKQMFSFSSALLQTAAQFEPAVTDKALSLETLTTAAPTIGYGDEARIKQVIAILLDNAIRHTPAGGKITVYLSQSDTKTYLTIVDTGEGIEKKHLDKIFNRFYQIDESRNTGSAGLGLAIAKSIVEGHSGSITVDSTPGAGATFTVEFPWGKKYS